MLSLLFLCHRFSAHSNSWRDHSGTTVTGDDAHAALHPVSPAHAARPCLIRLRRQATVTLLRPCWACSQWRCMKQQRREKQQALLIRPPLRPPTPPPRLARLPQRAPLPQPPLPRLTGDGAATTTKRRRQEWGQWERHSAARFCTRPAVCWDGPVRVCGCAHGARSSGGWRGRCDSGQ